MADAKTFGGPTVQPDRSRSRTVGGVLVVCNDVTQDHLAREALHLANHELQHRVKNTLAVLSAVAAQTFRDTSSQSALEIYQGRLAAFGRAHDLLTASHWIKAQLTKWCRRRWRRYGPMKGVSTSRGRRPSCDRGRRFRCRWRSTTSRPMRSNTAPSTVASGQVSIAWTCEDQDGQPNFVFVWQELGGPPVSDPASVGFGSRLISRVLQDDFGGTVEVSYQATGLICRLDGAAGKSGAVVRVARECARANFSGTPFAVSFRGTEAARHRKGRRAAPFPAGARHRGGVRNAT